MKMETIKRQLLETMTKKIGSLTKPARAVPWLTLGWRWGPSPSPAGPLGLSEGDPKVRTDRATPSAHTGHRATQTASFVLPV